MNLRFLAVTVVSLIVMVPAMAAQTSGTCDSALRLDLERRVLAYMELRDRVARTVPPMRTLPDPGEIRRRSDLLASAIQAARPGARRGDIFTPEIAALLRRTVRGACDDDFALLIALAAEDLDGPLPWPGIHGRWPAGAPLPTMPPDLLAALPPLPEGLEYRFLNSSLVLRDIDANLILDFVPDAIPAITSAGS